MSVVNSFVNFVRSPLWSVPIQSFMTSHCEPFLLEGTRRVDAKVFEEFKLIVSRLIVCFCDELHITPQKLCDALNKETIAFSPEFSHIYFTTDFEAFKDAMIAKNMEVITLAMKADEAGKTSNEAKALVKIAQTKANEALKSIETTKEKTKLSALLTIKDSNQFDCGCEEIEKEFQTELTSHHTSPPPGTSNVPVPEDSKEILTNPLVSDVMNSQLLTGSLLQNLTNKIGETSDEGRTDDEEEEEEDDETVVGNPPQLKALSSLPSDLKSKENPLANISSLLKFVELTKIGPKSDSKALDKKHQLIELRKIIVARQAFELERQLYTYCAQKHISVPQFSSGSISTTAKQVPIVLAAKMKK